MDWEANLTAIIRCTDANLEQQFRQFEDVTAEFSAVDTTAARDPGDNVANAYLRETMATEYRHRLPQEQEQTRAQTPSYSRVSGAFTRAPATSAAPTTTFSEHFHRRQERKRGVTAAGRAMDNQRSHRRGREYEAPDGAGQIPDHEVDEARYATSRGGGPGVYQQMYSSPTYDMAQMMEQVRLSLKLEVDARAAIAERQLSALLQLCKATSEELDRLRVEVCANDRQLHTLDQVQSKIRQELTTQKDIGFHLQSMCGKDESWRMQTENQLLELRQMVASLREQGNSVQALAQEKLSRSELLVQFNAAMEPIKAQLQANLQHQAQQIADITRTTSSSSLLLDGITQKVNRGITDEINELRSDLNALKHHVAKMDIFQEGGRGGHLEGLRFSPPSKEELGAKEKEEQQQREKRFSELRESLLKEVMSLMKDYVDTQTKPIQKLTDESASKFVVKRELETLQSALEESCRNRYSAAVSQADNQIKSLRDILRGECNAALRDTSDRIERSIQQTGSAMTTANERKTSLWQNKQHDLIKMLESEQKERKQALEELNEALRKSRHQLEDQIHSLTQESRSKLSQHDSDIEKRVNQVERQVENAIVELQRENQTTVGTLKTAMKVQGDSTGAELDLKLRRLEETISSTNLAVAALSKSMESLSTTNSSKLSTEPGTKDVNSALEKQASVYVSTMETLLQKMQLQLQLQAQSQVQMAMSPSPYHGYWPSSPFAGHVAPPPTLQLPPSLAAANAVEQVPALPATGVKTPASASPASGLNQTDANYSNAIPNEKPEHTGKLGEYLRAALPVSETSQLKLPAAPSSETSNPPPAVSVVTPEPKALASQRDLQSADNLSEANVADQSNKLEHTLNTTAKGALAEAELAKARVESRRKLELETKQQQQRQIPGAAPVIENLRSGSTINAANLTEGDHRRASVPAVVTRQAPSLVQEASALTRSASSSALPVKDLSVQSSTPAVEVKDIPPASAPNSAAIGGTSKTAPSSSLPSSSSQRAGTSEVAVAESARVPTIVSYGDVKSNSQPLPPVPVVVTVPAIHKSEADSARTSPEQAFSVGSVPTIPLANAPASDQQKIATALPLPISTSSPAPTTSKNACPPPLSPLAKIFARSSDFKVVETTESTASPTSGNTPKPENTTEAVEAAQIPTPTTDAKQMSAASSGTPSSSHVLCGLCRLPVRSDEKGEHERSRCPKRMVECVACKQQMPWVSLEMHELECNKRSDEIGAVVTASETKSVSGGGSAVELEGSLKKCRHCSADIPSLDLLEHEINCDKVLKQCPHCLRRQKMSELQEHIENCDCRLVSCPNDCGGKFLQRGIPNHLASRCPKKPVTASASAAPAPPRTAHPETNKSAPSLSTTRPSSTPAPTGKVECKFCDDEIDANKIDDHEQNCDWKPKRCQHCNMVVISRDLLRHETSCKTNLKLCPHCNENMPQSALTTHATRCSKRPIKCIRCCQLFPADAIVAHSTNCKFVPGTNAASATSSPQPQNVVGAQQGTSRAPIKIPPPPPFPPPPSTTPQPAPQQIPRRASADSRTNATPSAGPTKTIAPTEESASDRLARRNLALSQLTNPGAPIAGVTLSPHDRNSTARSSAPSLYSPGFQTRPGVQSDSHEEDEDEEDDDEYDEEDDDDQLTLAQVVKEWSVENVCLWLHEDVGVPGVVLRFQQKQCNGEMLLELTESDLINDFGVKDRIQRERILNAIEAIKTSDAFSDEDEEDEDEDEDEDDDEDELDESEGYGTAASPTTHMRHSIGEASYSHPRDILRRKAQPSPQRVLGSELPSSNDMVRNIQLAHDLAPFQRQPR